MITFASLLSDLMQHVEQIARATRQAIKPCHTEHFAFAKRVDRLPQLRSVGTMSIVQRYDCVVRRQLPASAIRLANNPRNVVPFEPSGSAMSSVAGRMDVSEGPGQSG